RLKVVCAPADIPRMRYPVRVSICLVLATAALALAGTAGANPQLAGLQVALARHGLYAGPVDAIPGPVTRAAIRSFQAHRGLVPDGIVGPVTAHRLCSLAVCRWSASQAHRAVTPTSVRALLDRWAAFYGVDHHLVRGIAWQESGDQPSVVSEQGAVGVMQITPETWAF